MTVLSLTVTERGRTMAELLPYPHRHGDMAVAVRTVWGDVDGLVLFVAVGAAVRIVAPLLTGKDVDPAVVCVDEAGRFVVAVLGGHGAGANVLANQVAQSLGATAVITTATDAVGVTALDQLPDFVATGDVAGVTRAMLDGGRPHFDNPRHWPLPAHLTADLGPSVNGNGPARILVTDEFVEPVAGQVVLHPPSLVAGVGASAGASETELAALLATVLGNAGLARSSLAEVTTIDLKAGEPAIVALGLPIRTWPAAALAGVTVPNPSPIVLAAVGTPSVAEAAALLAAGPGGTLVTTKASSATATVAIARRALPRGRLSVVGLGPGNATHRTPAASDAVSNAHLVIGYGPYVDQCHDLINRHHELIRSPIGHEEGRAHHALTEAQAGRRVALVCSGDAGVFAMATVALGLAGSEPTDCVIEVIPGITAALATAAVLGAPLAHDHAVISLSDLRTPWPAIEARLRAAAESDLVVALYNPRSVDRWWQLDAARNILLGHRDPKTPVGVVTDAARAGQRISVTTLGDLDPSTVGMTTCVIVGSTTTGLVNGRMVTPR